MAAQACISDKTFRFLDLPGELRLDIYKRLFDPASARINHGDGYVTYKFNLALLRSNRQIYYEARVVFHQLNKFVRIETPWYKSQQDVAIDGYVPVVVTGRRAAGFRSHHLNVVIRSPRHGGGRKFVLLLDDLTTFCKMWYYSDLNDIGTLNTSLQLTLKLRTPIGLSDRAMPLVLQRNLLEPFGMVKGLQDVQVLGNHSDEIEKRLRISMETPYRPAEKCLEDATNLSDAGIVASKTDPARAIALYLEAFEKIHIICDGRRRSVWGDGWFNIRLVGGRFDGEIGHVVKLILRTRLVLNIIKAYLDLKEYEEALFWGERAIELIKKAASTNDDEPVLSFPAAMELGKIYYYSGIAAKVLGNTLKARRYMLVATGYPRDEEELASVSPLLD